MAKKIIRLTENELRDLVLKGLLGTDPSKYLDNLLSTALKNKNPEEIDNIFTSLDIPKNSIDNINKDGEYNIRKPFGSEKTKKPQKYPISDSEYLNKVIKLLKAYEGFRSEAYKDAVGVWTIGFGSTYVDGRKVRRGDTITIEKAMQQKKNDINKFKNKIISQIGQHSWNQLDLDTKVVLTSIAYNYGSLPSILIEPARSGNKEKMSKIISTNLSKHNKGINAWRRGDEAAILASGESKRAPEYNV
jgi:GH24 family phage-related lysozyme (muramidase)